ncbi:MAG: Rap1a/Tai family immunity protein [Rhizomicrobium sp.]
MEQRRTKDGFIIVSGHGTIFLLVLQCLVFSIAASNAWAKDTAYEYAGDLNKACNSENPATVEMCAGFIAASVEIAANNQIYGAAICIPPRTPLNRVVKLTTAWMRTHPWDQTLPASLIVAKALATIFACK